MRTRVAAVSVLFGLILLATALVRYITALDLQRQEPTAPLGDIPAIVGLLASGAGLVAAGAAVLTRWSRPVVMMLAGMILIGSAGVEFFLAGDARRQEQTVLDRRWAEESGLVARRFPQALPGGRPDPAPLRGLTLVFGLLAGGVGLSAVGLALLLSRPTTPRKAAQGSPD